MTDATTDRSLDAHDRPALCTHDGGIPPRPGATPLGHEPAEHGRVALALVDAPGDACGAVTVNRVRALNQLRRLLGAGGPAAPIVDELRRRVTPRRPCRQIWGQRPAARQSVRVLDHADEVDQS